MPRTDVEGSTRQPQSILIDRADDLELLQTIELHKTDASMGTGEARHLYRSIALRLALTDSLCIVFALLLAWAARFGLGFSGMENDYRIVIFTAPLMWVAVFHSSGLYWPQHLSPAEEFKRTFTATVVGVLFLMLISFWFQSDFSRAFVGYTLVFALILEQVVRRTWRRYEGHLQKSGRLSFRTVIIGSNEEAVRMADALAPVGSGYSALGFVTVSRDPMSDAELPVLGHIDDLRETVRLYAIECLFVCSSDVADKDMLTVARVARQESVEVRISANLPEILASRLSVQPVGSALAISLRPVRLSGSQATVKRLFDLAFGTAALLFTLPFLALIALAVAVSSRGPVLFRQHRVTKGGRVFTMYKFRTMVAHADSLLDEKAIDLNTPFFKLKDDPRLTKVGRVLRKVSLDELPQLWNVIGGSMSLVGPRPLPVDQILKHELLRESPRHEVRSGITGWWQINGRSDISPEQALKMDLFYIENWSLSLDLYVISKTLVATVARRGAF